MNRQDLERIFTEEGVPPDAYDLYGGSGTEQFVLDGGPLNWTVYYSERGKKTNLKRFMTLSAACNYILRLVLKNT